MTPDQQPSQLAQSLADVIEAHLEDAMEGRLAGTRLVSIKQACDHLSVGPTKFRELAAGLETVRFGNSVRYYFTDIEKLVRENTVRV